MSHIEDRTINVEAEQCLLGSLLRNPENLSKIDVSAHEFSQAAHRVIFEAIRALEAARAPIDAFSVGEALEASGKLAIAGDARYILQLSREAYGSPAALAKIVKERALERQMLAASADIAALAVARDGRDVVQRQAEALEIMRGIANRAAGDGDGVSMRDAVQSAITQMEARIEKGDSLGGLPTGVAAIDKMIDGLKPGQLVIIGGRTAMGKSVLAMQIAIASAKLGNPVRYQSLEMSPEDLSMRAASSISGVSLTNIMAGNMTEDEYDLFAGAIGIVDSLPITIDPRTTLGHERIAACARKQQLSEKGLSLLIVDHLHLLQVPRGENKAQALGEVTGAFKRLAVELDIPVVLLAQLNRESAKGTPRAPTLTDFRDSGSIEQDADNAILIHRPGYYDPNENPNLAELIVAKCRNGKTGARQVGWNGECVRFEDGLREWNKPLKPAKSSFADTDL